MIDKVKAFLLRDTAGVPNWGWLIVIAGGIVVAVVIQRRGGFQTDSSPTAETVSPGDALAGSSDGGGASGASSQAPIDTPLPPLTDPGAGEGGSSGGSAPAQGQPPSGAPTAAALTRQRQQTLDIRAASLDQRQQKLASELVRQRAQAQDVHALAHPPTSEPRPHQKALDTTSYSTARERHYA